MSLETASWLLLAGLTLITLALIPLLGALGERDA